MKTEEELVTLLFDDEITIVEEFDDEITQEMDVEEYLDLSFRDQARETVERFADEVLDAAINLKSRILKIEY